ncbi:hypothetical protein ACIRBX_12045 [Kitasatospora sp. NPDC096147]|uniref:hypothetical protein n=1 Tax=Kitasatospora sp. NPDC096147 TaxID=3364093 RepID=UPI0037F6A2BE
MSANPFEDLVCDGCTATGAADVPATTPLVLGEKLWGLCDPHAQKFEGWFVGALEAPAPATNTAAA